MGHGKKRFPCGAVSVIRKIGSGSDLVFLFGECAVRKAEEVVLWRCDFIPAVGWNRPLYVLAALVVGLRCFAVRSKHVQTLAG